MVVWGGTAINYIQFYSTGGRYNPSTNSWTSTSTANVPSARIYHTAVWTGNEMIVWGGGDENFALLNTGGITILSRIIGHKNQVRPTLRMADSCIALCGLGVKSLSGEVADTDRVMTLTPEAGLIPSPTVRQLPPNVPAARDWHTAVWTGSEMIVWVEQSEAADHRSATSSPVNTQIPRWSPWKHTNANPNSDCNPDSKSRYWCDV